MARKSTAKKKVPARLPQAYVSSVAIEVRDRKRSLAWYTEKVGLDLLQDMGHWVTVGRKGSMGMIHLCEWSEVSDGDSIEPGLLGITLKVPGGEREFLAACETWRANGVRFGKKPVKQPWGWYARLKDPDGNEFMVMPGDQ
jgi:lactoylglutathione lyase